MCGRRRSPEATQNQLLLYVVLCVLHRHVREHTTVCTHYLVSPGAYLPSPTEHAVFPTVPKPQLVPWEEMPARVLKTRRGHGCRDLLATFSSLWRCQFGVEIYGHQKCGPTRPLAKVSNCLSNFLLDQQIKLVQLSWNRKNVGPTFA